MQYDFSKIKTLVVKIGTTLLSNEDGFDGSILENLVQDMARVKRTYDLNLLIVSSGAIGCGMDRLGMAERPTLLPLKQATAAVGQARLMHLYETLFRSSSEGLKTAQVLLSTRDLDDRQSYLNVRNTINTLFEFGDIVPIVNENDSTATHELRFGDNDTLSARVASKIDADLLIVLSDIDGLYRTNPTNDPDAKLIARVEKVTENIETFAEDTSAASSIGGMKTKLEAARIAYSSGLPMVITNGHRRKIISEVLEGTAPMTLFSAKENSLASRKRWIAFGASMKGRIYVDAGARNALVQLNKSLLPAGMVRIEGRFEPGDAVSILGPDGCEVARGLVNYSSGKMSKICGVKTHEIATHLGRKDYDEAIHRDNLVVV